MKVPNLLFLGLLLAVTASAQTPLSLPDAPGVKVTEVSWHKDVHIPALYDDPMRVNQEQADLVRDQKLVMKANAIRVRGGENPLPLPTRPRSTRGTPPDPSVRYLYEAKIKNTGVKTIRAIVWEHSVLDLNNGVEVGHHRFISNIKVRPGKTVNLVGLSNTPGVSILDATESGKESSTRHAERVTINRIEYDDGSFWQRTPN